MNRQLKVPLDTTPYPKDPRSGPIHSGVADGVYAYVQDATGMIQVLPDGFHVHPLILGGAQAAAYAGDLTIERGKVTELTSLSGTFQFDDQAGLIIVAAHLRKQGIQVETGAVRFFPSDGSRPIVLE